MNNCHYLGIRPSTLPVKWLKRFTVIRAYDGLPSFVCSLVFIFSEGLLGITNLYQYAINTTGSSFSIDFAIASLFSPLTPAESKVFSNISIHELAKDKLFVFQPDKKTLAYVFDNCAQAARYLTPARCAHLSDSDLKKNKNLQHIRRVINKEVLTTTEKGQFYIFQNPDHSSCLALVP